MTRVLALRLSWRSLTLIVCETGLIIGSVIAAAFIRLGPNALESLRDEGGVAKALLVAAVAQICLYYADLYNFRLFADRRELFVRILHALAMASLVLAGLYYWFPDLVIGRGVFMVA